MDLGSTTAGKAQRETHQAFEGKMNYTISAKPLDFSFMRIHNVACKLSIKLLLNKSITVRHLCRVEKRACKRRPAQGDYPVWRRRRLKKGKSPAQLALSFDSARTKTLIQPMRKTLKKRQKRQSWRKRLSELLKLSKSLLSCSTTTFLCRTTRTLSVDVKLKKRRLKRRRKSS